MPTSGTRGPARVKSRPAAPRIPPSNPSKELSLLSFLSFAPELYCIRTRSTMYGGELHGAAPIRMRMFAPEYETIFAEASLPIRSHCEGSKQENCALATFQADSCAVRLRDLRCGVHCAGRQI